MFVSLFVSILSSSSSSNKNNDPALQQDEDHSDQRYRTRLSSSISFLPLKAESYERSTAAYRLELRKLVQ